MAYQSVKAQLQKPHNFEKDGNEVEGVYLRSVPVTKGGKPSLVHQFTALDGRMFDIWGSKSLDTQMLSVAQGSRVKVIYHGKKLNKSGVEFNDIEVQIWSE